MDTKEAADYLGLSTSVLELWRTKGEGPQYTKLGESVNSRVRYRKADLDAWLKRHVEKPGKKR